MKKHLVSIISMLAVTASLATFAVSVAQAQVTCPAGYVCTPVQSTPGCPAGYSCAPVTTVGGGGGSTTNNTDATVTVNGTPTLALTYDSSNKESQLTATYDITVNGNTTGVNIYQGSGGAAFYNADGTSPNLNSQASRLTPVTQGLAIMNDDHGQAMYSIPAGHTAEFTVTGTASPSQMFAGTYYSSLVSLYANSGTTLLGGSFNLPVPANKTNTKTIVGELSPYITGFSNSQPFTPGTMVGVLGQRLDVSGGIFIDGASVGNSVKGDNNGIALAIPSYLTDGSHALQVKSITTGASNIVSFQTQSNGGGSSCYAFSTNLSLGSTGPDVVALQTWLIAHGYHMSAIESGKQPKGYYGNQTGNAVAAYQASIGIRERLYGYGYFGPQTRAAVNASCGGTPTPIPVAACPAGYICTPPGGTTVCPTGYVCTVVVANCPSGYTCYTSTPVSTVPPTTPPSSNNFTVSFQAVFNKSFNLSSVPSSATLSLAADNEYIAYVNGNYVGTGSGGTYGDDNFDHLTTYNVAQYLHAGTNTLSITGQNYYSSYTSWPNNAFGLLYKLTDQNGTVLAASDGTEVLSSATIGGGQSVVLSQPHQWYVTTPGASWIWDSADPLYATYLSYTGQSPTPVPTPQPNNGKLTVSLSSYPSDGVIMTPGQTVGVAAYNLQASNSSSMSLQSLALDFNVRPWLYANTITVRTDTGMIIGTANVSQSNTTEMAVGTDYRVMVPISNFVIAAGSSRTLSVSLTANPTSDRQSGPVSIIQVQARAVDASGVIDNESTYNTRTFQFQNGTKGSQGPVISGSSAPTTLAVGQSGTWSVNASDPNYGNLSYTVDWGDSCTGVCPAVMPKVAMYQTSTFTHSYSAAGTYTVTITVMNSAGLTAKTTSTVTVTGSTVTSGNPSVGASLVDGSSDKVGTFGVFGPGKGAQNNGNPYDWHFVATVITYGKTIKSIRILSNDNWQGWSTIDPGNYPMVVYQNGSQINSSYSSLNKTGDTVTLDLYGQPETTTWPGGNILVTFTDGTTASASIPASSITIQSATPAVPDVTVSGASAALGSPVSCPVGTTSVTCAYNLSFSFNLTAGNSPIFVTMDASKLTQRSVSYGLNLDLGSVVANPSQIAGDTASYYMVPPGTTRQFTVSGGVTGSATNGIVQIQGIYYGTSPSNIGTGVVNQGTDALKLAVTVTGTTTPTLGVSSNSNLTASIWDAIRTYYSH